MNCIQIYTTTPDRVTADSIINAIMDKQLASCIQVTGPVESTYRWKNKTEKSQELLLMIKTIQQNYKEIENIIHKIHPYELPEIFYFKINGGDINYLNWIKNESKGIKNE
jgi:periplasmic divalent cation tolerance protein